MIWLVREGGEDLRDERGLLGWVNQENPGAYYSCWMTFGQDLRFAPTLEEAKGWVVTQAVTWRLNQ